MTFPAYRFSVAPMMDWTDRHCRSLHRILTQRALLYTEMVTTGAIIYGPRERLLAFSDAEHPVALQLGGSDPAELEECARIAEAYGYREINLNVGCPSDRVQNGRFGACLMLEPELVGRCVAAMKAAVALPVTVKCRIGVDEQEPAIALNRLADCVVDAGVDALIVHARKAWLQGLSPRENREIPPLDYGIVRELKKRLRHLPISLNGGIATLSQAASLLEPADGICLDGVMLGRAAYQNPSLLLDVDRVVFGEDAPRISALDALQQYRPYVVSRLAEGVPLHAITRHILGLFQSLPGARQFRRHLSVEGVKKDAGISVYDDAIGIIRVAAERRSAA